MYKKFLDRIRCIHSMHIAVLNQPSWCNIKIAVLTKTQWKWKKTVILKTVNILLLITELQCCKCLIYLKVEITHARKHKLGFADNLTVYKINIVMLLVSIYRVILKWPTVAKNYGHWPIFTKLLFGYIQHQNNLHLSKKKKKEIHFGRFRSEE